MKVFMARSKDDNEGQVGRLVELVVKTKTIAQIINTRGSGRRREKAGRNAGGVEGEAGLKFQSRAAGGQQQAKQSGGRARNLSSPSYTSLRWSPRVLQKFNGDHPSKSLLAMSSGLICIQPVAHPATGETGSSGWIMFIRTSEKATWLSPH